MRFAFFASLMLLTVSELQAATLTILTKKDYLAPELVERWQQQTGHSIRETYYASSYDRDQRIKRREPFDLVVLDEVAARSPLYEKVLIDPQRRTLSNFKHINRHFEASCSQNSLPYLWGTLGLVYRASQYPQPPRSWQALLEPDAQHSGHIGMRTDYADAFTPALLMDNEYVSTGSQSALRKAFSRLLKQQEHVFTYKIASRYADQQSLKPLHLALAHSGDQHLLNQIEGGKDWRYWIPQEGSVLWVDCLGVASMARNPALARSFIDFLYNPENAAINMQALERSAPVMGAWDRLPAQMKDDPHIFIPDKLVQRLQTYHGFSVHNIRHRKHMISALLRQARQTKAAPEVP